MGKCTSSWVTWGVGAAGCRLGHGAPGHSHSSKSPEGGRENVAPQPSTICLAWRQWRPRTVWSPCDPWPQRGPGSETHKIESGREAWTSEPAWAKSQICHSLFPVRPGQVASSFCAPVSPSLKWSKLSSLLWGRLVGGGSAGAQPPEGAL